MDSDLQRVLQPQSDCDKEQGGHIFQELHREQVKLISKEHGGISKGIGSHFVDDPIAAAVPYHTCIIIRVSHESPIKFEFQGHRSLLGSSNHKVQQYYPTKCFLERCFGGEHCRALSAHPEPWRAGCGEEGRIFQSNFILPLGCKATICSQPGRQNVVLINLEDSESSLAFISDSSS